MLKTILTYVLCLLSVAARAQMRTDSIAEVTVQGQRVQGDVLSATPYRTIGREQIQTLGLTALADAVKMLAGADVKDYGGIGGLKTVSVRNIGAHHTAVSYDGICISNTQAGQIDIGRYTLDNIEEVALAVGQTGDLLQSARHYAAAALLNITTERPRWLSSRPSFQLSLRTGSFGLLNPSLRLWQPLGSRTLVAAHADYLRADGNYPFTLVNGRQQTRQHRNNTDIGAWKGEINLYHSFRDSSQLDLKAYYYYSQRGLPGVVILYNNSNHERLWDENFFTQARWRKSFNSHWKLQARLKYEHAWNRYEDTNTKYAGGKLTDINRQDEYYASATLAYTPTSHLDFALAQDLAVNCLRTNVEPQPNPRRFTSLSALTARYHDSRLTIGANLVATFINEHVANGSTRRPQAALALALPLLQAAAPREPLPARDDQGYLPCAYVHRYVLPAHRQHGSAPRTRHRIQRRAHLEQPAMETPRPAAHPRRLHQPRQRQNRLFPHYLRLAHDQLRQGAHRRCRRHPRPADAYI